MQTIGTSGCGVPANRHESLSEAAKMTEVIATKGLEFFKELVAVGGPSGDDDPPGNAAA